MFLAKEKKSLSDHIIYALDQGPLSGKDIVSKITRETETSKESVYRVLRELLEQEIINKAQKKYSINRHWIQRVQAFAQKHTSNPHQFDSQRLLEFNDGDSITYQFKNPDLMGIYWGHLYDYIVDLHPRSVPIIIFHPHEWLIHARKESEEYFLNRFEKEKRLVLFSIGGNSELDKKFKKEWISKYRKININYKASGINKNVYINILGDYIFEVKTNTAFEEAIDNFFKRNHTIGKSQENELKKIVQQHYKTKLVFSRNKKRAELLRKILSKEFYVAA